MITTHGGCSDALRAISATVLPTSANCRALRVAEAPFETVRNGVRVVEDVA